VRIKWISVAALAIFSLLTGCAKEPDPNWRLVARRIYLNPTTIQIRDGYTSGWFDFRTEPWPIFIWASPKHYLSLEAIDCTNRRMATMATRTKRGHYYELGEDSQKLQFEYVTPGSNAEAMLEAVCRNTRRSDGGLFGSR
jgi:hypothetical protein